MKPLYNRNGLMIWSEEEIRLRRIFEDLLFTRLKANLMEQNRGFQFFQCESPLLIPREYVSDSYTEEDIFVTQADDLVLKPETTASSYLYAQDLMNSHNSVKVRPPIVVWQHTRSARYERDLTIKNMRLKEFYQLEFQILFGDTTKNDYYPGIIEAMRAAAQSLLGPCRLEASDRLPSYSEETTDIICEKSDMEICSMSRRTDFPNPKIKVIEVAFGTDRCVYNFLEKDNT